MNTILKRKLSSVISGEIFAQNISKTKNHKIKVQNQTQKKKQNQKQPIQIKNSQLSANPNKRQKKTHYNANMEPINLSYTTSKTGISSCMVLSQQGLPKRIREVVWNTYNGETYSSKCYIPWCFNIINVFNYQVGHDIPESKGGTYDIGNLRPICSNCNLSMGNKWTIQEWGKLVNFDNSNKIAINDELNQQLENTMENIQKNNAKNTLTTQTQMQIQITNITFLTILFLAMNFIIF